MWPWGMYSRSLYPTPGSWPGEKQEGWDACPIVSREQGARVKLPKTVGMPRPSGKCQVTQRKGGQGGVWIPVLPLVWYFEVKNHWYFYSGTYLFLILYVLEKGEWQKKLLNIGDVHPNFSNVSWLVCWNPRIFINYLAHQSSRNSSTELIWRLCQNKLLFICQQPWVFPYSKYIYIYIFIFRCRKIKEIERWWAEENVILIFFSEETFELGILHLSQQ